MSKSKYTSDVTKGIVLSAGGTQRAFRWPAAIPGLGPRTLGVFSRCALCPSGIHPCVSGTWSFYGSTPICEACAIDEAARGAA